MIPAPVGPEIVCGLLADLLLQKGVIFVHDFLHGELGSILAQRNVFQLIMTAAGGDVHPQEKDRHREFPRQGSRSGHRAATLSQKSDFDVVRAVVVGPLVRVDVVAFFLCAVFQHIAHDAFGFQIAFEMFPVVQGREAVVAEKRIPGGAAHLAVHNAEILLAKGAFARREIIFNRA